MSSADSPVPRPQPPPGSSGLAPDAEARLREMLKRCSPATVEAACRFHLTGDVGYVGEIVRGVIERYVEPDLRLKFRQPDPTLRLGEDLGLDSLTLMEVVLLAEDVFDLSISHEELRQLRTLGDVQRFMVDKLVGPVPPGDAGSATGSAA